MGNTSVPIQKLLEETSNEETNCYRTRAFILIAFVPTAFAASPAKSFERQPIESNVIDRGEINTELNNDRKVNTKVSNDFSNINKSKMVMKEADLEINASWQDSPYFGIEPMDPIDTLLSGYYFTLADGDFSIADDFFTSQSNYGMLFSVLDPNAENNRRVFEKGESFFFNFDIIKSFNDSTGEITYIDKMLHWAFTCSLAQWKSSRAMVS